MVEWGVPTDESSDKGYLSETLWKEVSHRIPIACIDIIPTLLMRDGDVAKVGLIKRESPWGEVWCHLGGRVLFDETLRSAGRRHLESTLTNVDRAVIVEHPFFVNQFFVEQREGSGYGWDPRKHAIAICYQAIFPDNIHAEAMGEGKDFAWYSREQLPVNLWPGCETMLKMLFAAHDDRLTAEVGISPEAKDLALFASISDRQNSHNELMWQTPVLAMTAMAFLLTIALGDLSATSRVLAGLLSAAIALASIQLMSKHSRMQLRDADLLFQIEERLHMLPAHGPSRASSSHISRMSDRFFGPFETWLSRGRSRRWWLAAMMLFALVSIGASVRAVLHPICFSGWC